MKIALVHAFAWPEVRRGGERLVDDLTTYLRGAGHRVDVFTGTRGESQFSIGRHGRTYRLRIPWARGLGRFGLSRVETFGLRALLPLLLHRYDVVHAFTPTAAVAALWMRQRTVYTVIGHPTSDTLPQRRIPRSSLSLAISSSTEVAALSTSSATAIAAAFERSPIVLPPGVPVKGFAPDLNARKGPPRLLYSGDLGNPDKGVPILLEAFGRLLGRHPQARLALSGPGSPDRAFDAVGSLRSEIEGSIDVLGEGSVSDVPERYRTAHVTVLPSRNEAFGIVLVESLACGTPVVACVPGGAEDIVTDEQIGRLVPTENPEALADAIEACIDLAREPATPERCCAHAQTWDWTVIGPRYESVYESVAKRRGLRRGGRRERSAARPTPS